MAIEEFAKEKKKRRRQKREEKKERKKNKMGGGGGGRGINSKKLGNQLGSDGLSIIRL